MNVSQGRSKWCANFQLKRSGLRIGSELQVSIRVVQL